MPLAPGTGPKAALKAAASPRKSLGQTGNFLGKLGTNITKQVGTQLVASTVQEVSKTNPLLGAVAGAAAGSAMQQSGLMPPGGMQPLVLPGMPPVPSAPHAGEDPTNPLTAIPVSLPAGLNAAVPDNSIDASLRAKYPNIKCFYYATDGKYYPLGNLKKYGAQAGAGRKRKSRRRRCAGRKSRRRR